MSISLSLSLSISLSLYLSLFIYIYMHICVCIYIYIEREISIYLSVYLSPLFAAPLFQTREDQQLLLPLLVGHVPDSGLLRLQYHYHY